MADIEQNSIEILDINKLLRMLNKHGFTERHLHIVANNCEKPHVREMAIEYMVA